MLKTIKARYRNGLIEPLEEIEITEGAEITITVSEPPIPLKKDKTKVKSKYTLEEVRNLTSSSKSNWADDIIRDRQERG
jgi:predicted DNA-binding antitoxin AbrB/MazE fold protein